MIQFAAPGFLVAGALVALAAVALHLLVRSPPVRAPLPTARFLSPVRRAAVRFVRTPTDLLLLVMRVLFALALGAAFAGPVWSPPASADVTTVVLVDRGAGMAPVWTAAVDSARRIAGDAERAALVVFDTSASWIDDLRAGVFDSLSRGGTSSAESDYGAAFRALAGSAGGTLMGRVVLVTVPRWSSWGDGTRAARDAFRGVVEIVGDWGMGAGGTAGTDSGVHRIAAGEGTALRDAVEAIGWTGVDTVLAGEAGLIRVRYAGAAAPTGWRLEGDPSTGDRGVAGVVFLGGWAASVPRAGRLVPGDGESSPAASGGTGASGATIPARAVAAWRDGSIAAVAGREGEECVVTTAFPPDTGIAVLDPSYPELVRQLVSACLNGPASRSAAAAGGTLDSGAMAVLVGTGPAEAALPETSTGRSLAGPLLFLALLLAAGEWPLRNRQHVQES